MVGESDLLQWPKRPHDDETARHAHEHEMEESLDHQDQSAQNAELLGGASIHKVKLIAAPVCEHRHGPRRREQAAHESSRVDAFCHQEKKPEGTDEDQFKYEIRNHQVCCWDVVAQVGPQIGTKAWGEFKLVSDALIHIMVPESPQMPVANVVKRNVQSMKAVSLGIRAWHDPGSHCRVSARRWYVLLGIFGY